MMVHDLVVKSVPHQHLELHVCICLCEVKPVPSRQRRCKRINILLIVECNLIVDRGHCGYIGRCFLHSDLQRVA